MSKVAKNRRSKNSNNLQDPLVVSRQLNHLCLPCEVYVYIITYSGNTSGSERNYNVDYMYAWKQIDDRITHFPAPDV